MWLFTVQMSLNNQGGMVNSEGLITWTRLLKKKKKIPKVFHFHKPNPRAAVHAIINQWKEQNFHI